MTPTKRSLIVALLLGACSSDGGSGTGATHVAQKGGDLATVLAGFRADVVDAKNTKALTKYYAKDAHLHIAGQELNVAKLGMFLDGVFKAVPDLVVRHQVIETSGTSGVVIEVERGTHTGGPFFGVPARNEPLSFPVLHIYRLERGLIAEEWAQPNLSVLLGTAPAQTLDEMQAELAKADALGASQCPNGMDPTELQATWVAVKQMLTAHDSSQVDKLTTPDFRVTNAAGLNLGRDGLRQGFALVGAIGSHFDLQFDVKYVGSRFIAVYGPSVFDYLNPEGAFGFPVVKMPKHVAANELHILGTCYGRMFRQYAYPDTAGLFAQLMN
jgi:predicted ester cyclase